MAKIHGRVYRLTEQNRFLFESLYPEMDKKALYFLVSPSGTLTFSKEPNHSLLPHFESLIYYDIEFDDE